MGEQGHHEDHGLGRRAQPRAGGACGGAERLVTHVTDAPLFLLRMDTNSALAGVAAGRTGLLGADYRCGVHACPPSSVGERTQRRMSGPPLCYK